MRHWMLGMIAIACGIGAVFAADEPASAPTSAPAAEKGTLIARVKMATNVGDIVIELDGEKAPISTRNLLRYAKEGFYDGLIFHRVMSDFMIQGGGFTVDLEKKEATHPPIKNEWQNGLKNDRGTIAMARTSDPDSATAQFFINVVDNPSLDQARDGAAYAVFGKVVEGMDVVDKIRNTEVKEDPKLPMGKVVPVEPIIISGVEVLVDADEDLLKQNIDAAKQKQLAEQQESLKELMEGAEAARKRLAEEATGGVVPFENGLIQYIQKEGSGDSPTDDNTVTIHFSMVQPGANENRTLFSSKSAENPPTLQVRTIRSSAMKEALKAMKPGGHSKFYIPPELGLQDTPGRQPIPLILEVELLEVK